MCNFRVLVDLFFFRFQSLVCSHCLQHLVFNSGSDQSHQTLDPQVKSSEAESVPVGPTVVSIQLCPAITASFRLFEAAGAAHLPAGVQLGRDGVRHDALQDVVLRGHDVLDQEVCSFGDVEIVLKMRHKDKDETLRQKMLLQNENTPKIKYSTPSIWDQEV